MPHSDLIREDEWQRSIRHDACCADRIWRVGGCSSLNNPTLHWPEFSGQQGRRGAAAPNDTEPVANEEAEAVGLMSEADTLFAQCRTGWRVLTQEEWKLVDSLARKRGLTQTDLEALKDIAVKAHARIGADMFAY